MSQTTKSTKAQDDVSLDRNDRIKGCIYGQAIGDALGLAWEFKSQEQIRLSLNLSSSEKRIPKNLEYRDVYREGDLAWTSGEFSDDTGQALVLINSYFEVLPSLSSSKSFTDPDRDLLAKTVAKNLLFWLASDGRGAGGHTLKVMLDAMFLLDPLVVSEGVWEESGRYAAPNGAVMRTSYLGLFSSDVIRTEELAILCAKVTHWDPRSVSGAVAVALTVSALTQGLPILRALQTACDRASRISPDAYQHVYASPKIEDLKLDEGLEKQHLPGQKRNRKAPIGFVWKTTSAGFWALGQLVEMLGYQKSGTDEFVPGRDGFCEDYFRDILQRVILAGGDTDTNAAVAGAMMGACLGFSNLPEDLISGLNPDARKQLDAAHTKLLSLRLED